MVVPLLSLDADVLVSVFHRLDPVSLACLSCCCRALRAIVERDDLWQPLCRNRWHNPRRDTGSQGRTFDGHGVATALAAPSWHSIYVSQNGWRAPSVFKAARSWNSHDPGEMYAFVSCTACELGLESGGQVAIACSQPYEGPPQLELHELTSRSRRIASYAIKGGVAATSLTTLSAGKFAAGTLHGSCIYAVEQGADSPELAHVWTTPRQSSDTTVMEVQHARASQQLFELRSYASGARRLHAWDLAQQRQLACVEEFMHSYDLCCGPLQLDDAGHELMCASTYAGCCNKCGLACMCCHKSHAHTAALCIFDSRAGTSMMQRFTMHHRTVYPRLCLARGSYIMTSHVGTPLCVWDKRFMSAPLYEQGHLKSYLQTWNHAPLPLGLPYRPAEHQAMYLACDDDVLIGRAENGMLWMWDLTSCLGWARRDTLGSWRQLRRTQDWSTFRDWPQALGAWHWRAADGAPPTPAAISVQSGQPWHLVGICHSPFDREELYHDGQLQQPSMHLAEDAIMCASVV